MEDTVGRFLVDMDQKAYNFRHVNHASNNKVAVIVDTRSAFFLPKVIKNFMIFLGLKWNLHVIHGKKNAAFLERELVGWHIRRTQLALTALTPATYSQLLLDPGFWQLFPEEHILIFQLDALLVKPIPDFYLQFDMIGAPCGREGKIMNGGLSLRRKSAMLRCLNGPKKPQPGEAEDVYFTETLQQDAEANVPDVNICMRFSAESHAMSSVVGGHGTNKYYLTGDQWQALLVPVRY